MLSASDRRQVGRLLEFALGLVPVDARPGEGVEIFEDDRPSGIVAGAAWDDCAEIYLPADLTTRSYPRRYTYRKGAGTLRYECWHEEVVGTMAHELRHVAQAKSRPSERPPRFEVDAELFARFAIDLYRQRKRCRHAKAA